MTEEFLSKLRGVRKVYLHHVENSSKEVNDILKTFLPDSNFNTIIRLNTLTTLILNKTDKIKGLDEQLLSQLNEKDSEKQLDQILTREDRYLHTISKIDLHLSKPTRNSEPNKFPQDLSFQISETAKVCLTKLVIGKFDGDVINWSSFWDQLSSAIHENDSLNKINKFTYWKSFLCDSAKLTISGLSLSSENYKEAIDLLKQRYGNTQVLVNAFMKKFIQLPPVQNSNNVECLRHFYDQVETSVRNLKTLGVEINMYGSLLTPLLNEEIPDNLRLKIPRKFDNDVWELSEILNLVKNELEAKERSSFMLSHTSDQYQDHTTAALLVKGGTENKRACVFCNKENHISHKYLKVSDPKTRFSILRRKKLCFICFKGGHLSIDCSKFKD